MIVGMFNLKELRNLSRETLLEVCVKALKNNFDVQKTRFYALLYCKKHLSSLTVGPSPAYTWSEVMKISFKVFPEPNLTMVSLEKCSRTIETELNTQTNTYQVSAARKTSFFLQFYVSSSTCLDGNLMKNSCQVCCGPNLTILGLSWT